jgi:hypothetical protein
VSTSEQGDLTTLYKTITGLTHGRHRLLSGALTRATILGALFLVSFVGCAQHYRGSVVDRHNHPVPYARIEGHGMHHAFPLGEGPFVRRAVADAAGHFDLVSTDWPSKIVAISPDSRPPYVIVIE